METRSLPAFYVVGLSIRTTNQNDQAMKDIGELWNRFLGENISDSVPGKVSDDKYGIYTDYESDANGPYTVLLGHKVSSMDSVPEGLTGREIPAGNYALFKAKGKIPDVVVETWQRIWNSDIKRAYASDFELYKAGSVGPDISEVETYVSVKS
jgi:predicted transcriptional regulator YdeE